VTGTAYFIVAEALTNAAKHARASVARVGVRTAAESLEIAVHDDGVGGADPALGSGIVGLRDRVDAAGGRLSVRSPAGEGTELVVQLPLASDSAG
jgi:signal transduction histidine kinase